MSSARQAHSGFPHPQKHLRKHNWRLDAAIDLYYSGPGASGTPQMSGADPEIMERIVDLFNKYEGICPNRFSHPVSDNCAFDPQIETQTRSQATEPSSSVKI